MSTDSTTVPTEDLRALFDIATGSLNFTSGFLDTDDVNLLRKIAVLIGVDPRQGTPREFASQYPHELRPAAAYSTPGRACAICVHPADHGMHQPADERTTR